MTEEEIIDLADDAGSFSMIQYGVTSAKIEWLKKFADLVAAREREVCAKVCEQLRDEDGYEAFGVECATAIRAMGGK